jgi:hypothetical protein
MKEQFADLVAKTNALVEYMNMNKKKVVTNKEINKIPPSSSKKPEMPQRAVNKYYNLIIKVKNRVSKSNVNTETELRNLLSEIQKMVIDNNKVKVIETPNNYQKVMIKYAEYIKKLKDGIIPSTILFSSMSNSVSDLKKLVPNFSGNNLAVVPVPKNAKNSKVIFQNYFNKNIQKDCVDVFFLGPTGAGKTYISKLFYEFVTGKKVNQQMLIGMLRTQYVSAYYPKFDFVKKNGDKKVNVFIRECVDLRDDRELTYGEYTKKYIKPTVYNTESSRAHLMYSLPPAKGMKTIAGGMPGKRFNIIDLCGIESPVKMSLKTFGFNIMEILNVNLKFLYGMFSPTSSANIAEILDYMTENPEERKREREKSMIEKMKRSANTSTDKNLKTMWGILKDDIKDISDLHIFLFLARTLKVLTKGPPKNNNKTQNSKEQEYKMAFFKQMSEDPGIEVGEIKTGVLGNLFKKHSEVLKKYTLAKYMFEMFKRCLESIYIEDSLSNIKKVFNPNIKKELSVVKNVNVSFSETSLLSKYIQNNNRKSKKYLLGVVNPTVENKDIKEYHIKMLNNFKKLTK